MILISLSVKAIYSQVECALYAKVHNRLETYVVRDLLSDFSEWEGDKLVIRKAR